MKQAIAFLEILVYAFNVQSFFIDDSIYEREFGTQVEEGKSDCVPQLSEIRQVQ